MEAADTDAPTGSRLAQLASDLGHLTEQDMLLLADVTPGTLEAWRKRGQGPAYVLAGNRYFYPREAVSAWLGGRTKSRDWTSVRETL